MNDGQPCRWWSQTSCWKAVGALADLSPRSDEHFPTNAELNTGLQLMVQHSTNALYDCLNEMYIFLSHFV